MTPLRIRLNAGFSGPQAGFFLAEADGHLAAEGIAVRWLPGNGAAAVIEDMDDADCDLAYGDLCALVARLGRMPAETGPQAIHVAFTRTPLTIAVAADGPVHTPADLAGRRVSGHARDAALLVFPALAQACGLDAGRVTLLPSAASLAEQVRAMLEDGAAEGVFGFVNTIIASLEGARLPLAPRLRFLEYADHLPDLFGNALVASRRLAAGDAGLLRGLCAALARGLQAAAADPDRAVAAIRPHHPALDVAVETRRLRRTLASEMAVPAARPGDADPARLDRGIAILADALRLPRRPAAAELFSAAWLPAAPMMR